MHAPGQREQRGRAPPWTPSLRLRILSVAVLPALIGVLLAMAYFAHRSVSDAERVLRGQGQAVASRLALTIQYPLFVGNTLYIKQLLDYERGLHQALAIGVVNGDGRWEAFSGEARLLPLPREMLGDPMRLGHQWLFTAAIHAPELGAADPYLEPAPKVTQGVVAVVLDDAPLHHARTEALTAALGIASLLILLTGFIAWRLSARLGDRLLALSLAVGRIADGALQTRVKAGHDGELALLEEGVNRMAFTLEENRDELEHRIRAATSELRAQTQAAEAAVLAKSRFLAAASHDLRQPLHALTLLIAALKERIGDGEGRRLAEHLESSAAAMGGLLNALLDLSRLDAGAVQVRSECFRVDALFRRLEERYAPMARDKGLRLSVRATRMCVQTDPVLLERILNNLISNAIQYTQRGGVVVGVRRGPHESMRFLVCDSGRGVPPESRQRIFEEYFQLDNPERDRDKGLGLGLAIVDRLARLLDCPVRLRSELGRGSCFSLCGQRCLVPRPYPEAENVAIRKLGRRDDLVLLIDDDESILEAMLELFDGWGVELAVATSAKEAVADLLGMRRVPALVLCDYRLRDGETGLQAVALLRRHFGEAMPAVLITGDTAPDTLRQIETSGLPALHKPLRPANLRAMLGHYLGVGGQTTAAEDAAAP